MHHVLYFLCVGHTFFICINSYIGKQCWLVQLYGPLMNQQNLVVSLCSLSATRHRYRHGYQYRADMDTEIRHFEKTPIRRYVLIVFKI
jgi:hypothetical protein